uniref:N-acetylmuramoyl-L-alanine amidase-like n=1 Tax=Pristiophorus japonicus TaxID=55135 RepID=UPI00398EB02F
MPDYHLNNVLSIIEELEGRAPAYSVLNITAILRGPQTPDRQYPHRLPGETPAPPAWPQLLSEAQRSFMDEVMNHEVGPSVERGVVLMPDGTTVAVSRLLAGIEAALRRKAAGRWSDAAGDLLAPLDNLYPLTLAGDLGRAFAAHHLNRSRAPLGPGGCWDSVTSPRVFTGAGLPSLATDAVINGGMDGFILGDFFAGLRAPLPKLSAVLRDYYGEARGGQAGLKASARRRNFAAKVDRGEFTDQVLSALYLYSHIMNNSALQHLNYNAFRKISQQGVKQFHHRYLECPAIIPRCMWGAKPYRGTPVRLALPLRFVYIHHTYEPSRPCNNFRDCAADMRSMQRFHQDVRRWNDIAYNFVAGSDGYLYEGRGWLWQGSHTKAQNSKGYGVSFIGNYTSELPDQTALELVRENLMNCAVTGQRLVSDYKIHGHRQHRSTACPGERLFTEIKNWEAFKEVEQANKTSLSTAGFQPLKTNP